MFTDRWVMREFVASVRTKENLKARRAGTASEPSNPTPPDLLFLITVQLKLLAMFLMDFVLGDGRVCGAGDGWSGVR